MKERASKPKSKVMAAAAIGAVAILLASTLVRCAASGTDGQTEGAEANAGQQTEAVHEAEGGAKESGRAAMEQASGISWVAEDGSGASLQITESLVVEKSADGAIHALAYAGADESQTEGQAIARLTLEDGSSATLIFSLADGRPEAVSSDALTAAERYVAKAEDGSPGGFEVRGLDERYIDLIGGRDGELSEALSAFAAERAPQATAASFDGEVYLDLNQGAVSATFHLNDSASTVVTAIFQEDAFEII